MKTACRRSRSLIAQHHVRSPDPISLCGVSLSLVHAASPLSFSPDGTPDRNFSSEVTARYRAYDDISLSPPPPQTVRTD